MFAFLSFLNARCPKCGTRVDERDLGKAQHGTRRKPFTCPVCDARLIPRLSGNPVIRLIGWLVGELAINVVAVVLLIGFFVLPWWAALILPVALLVIFDIVSGSWPLVHVPDDEIR